MHYPNARFLAASLGAALSLSGCQSVRQPILTPLLSTGETNTSASHQLLPEAQLEHINLLVLLDPDDKRKSFASTTPQTSALTRTFSSEPAEAESIEFEKALRAFYLYDKVTAQRNRVQDRLLAASDQRCNTYKNYLRRVETTQSSLFGSLTTMLAGAGAIATPATTVRALSGLAGISSGVGAELRQSYFSGLATQVIVPGIDLARDDLRQKIAANRKAEIGDYTVEAAIAEAVRYHGACSMNTGLERSGKAVSDAKNIGLGTLKTALDDFNSAKEAMKKAIEASPPP